MREEAPNKQLRRARITAMVFAFLSIFSLLMLVYAVIKKTEAEAMHEQVNQLEMQVQYLKSEAEEQRILAEAERQRAEENYRNAMERLEATEAKKLK